MTKIEVEQFVNFNYEWETKRLHKRMTDSDKHTEYMKIRRNLENINLKNIDVDNDVHIYVKMQSNEHEIEGWKFDSFEDAEKFLESITFIVNAKK